MNCPHAPKPTAAFLTGSHAYGIPHANSDIDLAVLVSEKDSDFLWKNAEQTSENPEAYPSIRFGKLNLIVFYNAGNFEEWRKVTNALIAKKPVTRKVAVAAFQDMLNPSEAPHDPEAF